MRSFKALALVMCWFAPAPAAFADVLPPISALPPIAATTLRSGAGLVAIAAPDSPLAVVLLSARVPDRALSPDQRATLRALAHALAQGRSAAQPGGLDLAGIGGVAKARVDADTLAVSLTAPADRFDDLVRALEARLKARRALMPAQGDVAALPAASPALPDDVVAYAAPRHPDALPVDTAQAPIDPRVLRELADVLLQGANVRIVVLGPRTAPELLSSAERALASPLPPGAPTAVVAHTISAGTHLSEVRADGARGTESRVWLFCADADAHARAAADAAVLAELLGGRLMWTDDAVAIAVDVSAPRASAAPRAEGRVLESLAQLGATAPSEEAVARARERARAARLSLWKDPESLALTLARASSADAPQAGVSALAATTPDSVRALARNCATGPRMIRRVLGDER